VLPRPSHRPAPASAGAGLSGPVRRPLLGLDPGPPPPHQPAPQPQLDRRRPPGPSRPPGRAVVRAGLAGVSGHPRPGAAAQEPGLGLPALSAGRGTGGPLDPAAAVAAIQHQPGGRP
jgi:hypothetical protein